MPPGRRRLSPQNRPMNTAPVTESSPVASQQQSPIETNAPDAKFAAEGKAFAPEAKTFAPLVRAFLDYLHLEKHFSDYTVKCYGADLFQFSQFLSGQIG